MFDAAGPVLGIDPGVSRCGYGAVRTAGGVAQPLAYGVLRTDPADPLPARLTLLEDALSALVAEIRPCALAVERVLFQVNVRSAMAVGQASGLALVVAHRAGVPVRHYSPNEVKLAVAGHGGAGKPEVQRMVCQMLRLTEIPKPPDVTDALALALCHLAGAGLRGAVGADTGDATPEASPRLARAVAAALARENAR